MPARISSQENLCRAIGWWKPSPELARTGRRQEIRHQGEHGQDHPGHEHPQEKRIAPLEHLLHPQEEPGRACFGRRGVEAQHGWAQWALGGPPTGSAAQPPVSIMARTSRRTSSLRERRW